MDSSPSEARPEEPSPRPCGLLGFQEGRSVIQHCFLEAVLGVLDRLVLSDEQWERIAPLIIGRPDQKRAVRPSYPIATADRRGLGCRLTDEDTARWPLGGMLPLPSLAQTMTACDAETDLREQLPSAPPDKASAARIDVELKIWDDTIHIWPFVAAILPEGQQSI